MSLTRTLLFSVSVFVSISLFHSTLLGQDTAAPTTNTQDQLTDSNSTQISGILKRQARAWNEGDLERFMETYWKSDKLTFSSGGKTTRGWKATLENYKKGYAPPKEMGHLKFDQLEIIKIEDNSALVLGNWHLTMKDESTKAGNFSLVVLRFDGEWKIIHDHSSTLEPTKE